MLDVSDRAATQVVYYDYFVTPIQERIDEMGSNVPGAAGYDYMISHG